MPILVRESADVTATIPKLRRVGGSFVGLVVAGCAVWLLAKDPTMSTTTSSWRRMAELKDGDTFEKDGKMYKNDCRPTSTYTLQETLHNNFGGAGPDSGDEGITLKALRHKPAWLCPDGDCLQHVKIEMHSLSKYSFANPAMNGIHGKFSQIALNTGDSAKVELTIVDAETGKNVHPPFMPMSLYDIDSNADDSGQEYVRAFGEHTSILAPGADITKSEHEFGGFHEYRAELGKGMAPNPKDPAQLTSDQKKRSVSFNFIKPDKITIEVGSSKGVAGPPLRVFSFDFENALSSCNSVFLYDVTTAAPVTTTAAPVTTTAAPKTTAAAPKTTAAPAMCKSIKKDGYKLKEVSLAKETFQVSATCAEGFEGTAQVLACSEADGQYIVKGCHPVPVHEAPKPVPVPDECEADTKIMKMIKCNKAAVMKGIGLALLTLAILLLVFFQAVIAGTGSPLSMSTGKASVDVFGPLAILVQLLILGCYMNGADYDITQLKDLDKSSIYNFYVGVALMMFVGFGYLMTFLKSYGLGAVGFTMFITCLGVQWAMIVENYMVGGMSMQLDMMDLLNGNFAVAAVLISFGGLIGKTSPTQLLVLTMMELVFYCANKVFFLTNLLSLADCGGTIIIHVFGAYFGLAACATLGPAANETLNASSYNSDLFSLIGTVFLWLYWPSFVAGGLPAGTDGHGIALLNTVLALLASTVITFGLMPMMSGNRLGTVPVQNATLAGGVSIGATANLPMGPFAAVVVGIIAGLISCYGFIKPLITSSYDTCGINNLHGMPGLFGGLVSVVLPIILGGVEGIKPGNQLIGLIGTFAFAVMTGGITGTMLKNLGSPSAAFNDESFWDAADDMPKVSDESAAPLLEMGVRTVYCCSDVQASAP